VEIALALLLAAANTIGQRLFAGGSKLGTLYPITTHPASQLNQLPRLHSIITGATSEAGRLENPPDSALSHTTAGCCGAAFPEGFPYSTTGVSAAYVTLVCLRANGTIRLGAKLRASESELESVRYLSS
jgi:hypothetical protein